jgi:egghead protein (zeste-white 4 protein)
MAEFDLTGGDGSRGASVSSQPIAQPISQPMAQSIAAVDASLDTLAIHLPTRAERAKRKTATEQVAPLRPRSSVAPRLVMLPVVFVVALALSWWIWQPGARPHVVGWATSVLWTMPLTTSLIGIYGALRTVGRLRADRHRGPARTVRTNKLLVTIPTIGRHDTYPALERVVRSCRHLAAFFPEHAIEIVVEEGCKAFAQITALAKAIPMVEVVTVPRDYRTPNGTRYKARANHYANVRRIARGEALDTAWVLHLDDDTAVGPDAGEELARFVGEQRGQSEPKHLAQGVLTYPREHGTARLIWLADSVRPAYDVTTFAATTGSGTPRAGLHGELLLVRASVEADIGWDFGPRTMVEDAQFALEFTRRHPGRSDWFAGRSLGATPVSVGDFVKQRERWAWGLLELSANRDLPLRARLLVIHNVIVCAFGPLQHIGVVLVAGGLLGDLATLPITVFLLPLWALNIAYHVWSYWEGLKINARASSHPRRRWWEPLVMLGCLPVFSLWEAAGVLRGLIRFVRHGEAAFTVIAKPR